MAACPGLPGAARGRANVYIRVDRSSLADRLMGALRGFADVAVLITEELPHFGLDGRVPEVSREFAGPHPMSRDCLPRGQPAQAECREHLFQAAAAT